MIWGGVIKTNSQSTSVPAGTQGALYDVTITPTSISGYTAIGFRSYYIAHPTNHSLKTYYLSGNSWIFRVEYTTTTSQADDITISFIYIRNDMIS